MQQRLTTSSIFFSKQTALLLFLFFFVRITSFYLIPYPIVQSVIIFVLIMTLGFVFFKNPANAWLIVLGELLLGGSGHLFSMFGLSVRTCLILAFLFLWVMYLISPTKPPHIKLFISNRIFYALIPLSVLILVGALVGMYYRHSMHNVLADIVPYVFLLLSLPAFHLFSQERIQHCFVRLIGTYIIGSALFALYTFTMFVSGIYALQGPYYKWFRDVLMGKITYVTDFYYRIVTPEHLLIVPVLLIICALLMRDERHHKMWRFLFMVGSIVLALNFSRAYLLGFVVGLVFLLYKHKFSKWLRVSLWSGIMVILIFICINIAASGGKSMGLEIAGLRAISFVNPDIELSTVTRTILIKPISQLIQAHPFLGNGLGSSITYIDPTTYLNVPTNQFDWGYLELWAELGIFGLLWWLILMGIIISELIKKIRSVSDFHDLYVGLLGGVIALLIINITTPALYHVLGILYLSLVIAFISKPVDIFDNVVTLLYRIFNKLKG